MTGKEGIALINSACDEIQFSRLMKTGKYYKTYLTSCCNANSLILTGLQHELIYNGKYECFVYLICVDIYYVIINATVQGKESRYECVAMIYIYY